MIPCAKRGCPDHATHHLGVRVWPRDHDQAKTKPFDGSIGLALCRLHAEEATTQPHLVVTDPSWAAIEFVLACNSPQKPDRSTLELYTKRGLPPKPKPERMTAQ